MRNWQLTVPLDRLDEKPLYLQLADAVSEDIRRGRLQPGEPLPGTRELGRALGLNRNTIVAGYAELSAEGLIEAHPRGGTFVAARQANLAGFPNTSRDAPTYALDGKSIVYTMRVSGDDKLFQIDLATKQRKQLTFGSHDDTAAKFYDDHTLVFTSTATDPKTPMPEEVLRNAKIPNASHGT